MRRSRSQAEATIGSKPGIFDSEVGGKEAAELVGEREEELAEFQWMGVPGTRAVTPPRVWGSREGPPLYWFGTNRGSRTSVNKA